MKKSESKIILNFAIKDEEFEEKVKIALDEYAEKVILKNLDDTIAKIVQNRIERLTASKPWESARIFDGKSLNTYVQEKVDLAIKETVDKNLKEILSSKIAKLLIED